MKKIKSGFTLIELLVVVAIIGVLSSVVMASTSTARAKGRDATRLSDVRQMAIALELYNLTNGSYPASSGICDYSSGTGWDDLETLLSPYIKKLPKDPSNKSTWGYCYSNNNALGPYIKFSTENSMPNIGNTIGNWKHWAYGVYEHFKYLY
jgi:type II secretion system protein G